MSPNLSTPQILNFLQCPRRFWLEQYHPEHEGDVDDMDTALDAEEHACAVAHEAFEGENVCVIDGTLGLRNAIEQTTRSLAPGATVLNATFEYDGVSAQAHVLDWSDDANRAISVSAAERVQPQHVEACAVQDWVMRGLDLPAHRYLIGLLDPRTGSGDDFRTRFSLTEITDRVVTESDRLASIVDEARRLHASLDEPPAQPGDHCHKPGYACPFLDYCSAE